MLVRVIVREDDAEGGVTRWQETRGGYTYVYVSGLVDEARMDDFVREALISLDDFWRDAFPGIKLRRAESGRPLLDGAGEIMDWAP